TSTRSSPRARGAPPRPPPASNLRPRAWSPSLLRFTPWRRSAHVPLADGGRRLENHPHSGLAGGPVSDEEQKQKERAFVPALSRFGALYDPVVALTCKESVFRPKIIEQLALRPGLRVLDLGCGTGTLAVAIATAQPGVSVVAVDADEKALRRARRKAE